MIATIGYQGAGIDDVVAALREADIDLVVDIRAAAWSRRPEFQRRTLSARLAAAGVEYRHAPALGNPDVGREAPPVPDTEGWHRRFERHLSRRPAVLALRDLAATARRRPVCLMCMERRPEDCHRSLVAARLALATGDEVRHLFPGRQREMFV
jgi:uncharacterized protein (DUF488 family)